MKYSRSMKHVTHAQELKKMLTAKTVQVSDTTMLTKAIKAGSSKLYEVWKNRSQEVC